MQSSRSCNLSDAELYEDPHQSPLQYISCVPESTYRPKINKYTGQMTKYGSKYLYMHFTNLDLVDTKSIHPGYKARQGRLSCSTNANQ